MQIYDRTMRCHKDVADRRRKTVTSERYTRRLYDVAADVAVDVGSRRLYTTYDHVTIFARDAVRQSRYDVVRGRRYDVILELSEAP